MGQITFVVSQVLCLLIWGAFKMGQYRLIYQEPAEVETSLKEFSTIDSL